MKYYPLSISINDDGVWFAEGQEDGTFGYGIEFDNDAFEVMCNTYGLVRKEKYDKLQHEVDILKKTTTWISLNYSTTVGLPIA